jgi:OPA family glycerol-3-phosphate transporter-like MFS transporter
VTHYGWRSAFWVPAIFCALGAFWLLNRLTDSPESMGLPSVEVHREGATPAAAVGQEKKFWGIFREHILYNKWVWIVSFANFFIYIVRSGVSDWAPKYLVETKGFTLQDASISAAAFEIAGIFGAYAAGWISDKLNGRRGPVSVFFMLMLVVAVALLFSVPAGQRVTMGVLFAALGFLVYGPQLLVAVAAADFATKVASSSAVGLTGLLGYLGATVSGVGTGMLVDAYGWNGAIWLYGISALIGSALLALTWSQTAATAARERA